jgi:hypothetical protein
VQSYTSLSGMPFNVLFKTEAGPSPEGSSHAGMDAMKTMADWLETVRTRRRFYCMISPGPLIASLKRPSSRGLVPPLRRDGAGLA